MTFIGPPARKGNLGKLEPMQISKEEHEIFKNFGINARYLAQHKNDLRPKFGDNYVAVYNCAVVDFDKDDIKLRERIEKRYGGYKAKSVVVQYIYKVEPHFILQVV